MFPKSRRFFGPGPILALSLALLAACMPAEEVGECEPGVVDLSGAATVTPPC